MPYPAFSETINKRTSQVSGQEIVDKSTYAGSYGSAEHHEKDVELARRGCFIGSRRHDHFAWEGNETALDSHQQSDDPVVEVLQAPCYEGNGFHYDLTVLQFDNMTI